MSADPFYVDPNRLSMESLRRMSMTVDPNASFQSNPGRFRQSPHVARYSVLSAPPESLAVQALIRQNRPFDPPMMGELPIELRSQQQNHSSPHAASYEQLPPTLAPTHPALPHYQQMPSHPSPWSLQPQQPPLPPNPDYLGQLQPTPAYPAPHYQQAPLHPPVSTQLIQVAHEPPTYSAPLPSSNIRNAMDVPQYAKAAAGDDTSNMKLKSQLKRMHDLPEQERQKIQQSLLHLSDQTYERENPFTAAQRKALLITWREIIQDADPSVTEDMLWTEGVVRRYACYYLWVRTHWTPGRGGRQHVKAGTLGNWYHHTIACIARFTRISPQKPQSRGLQLLAQEGLMVRLENTMHEIVDRYQLDRYQDRKVYIGRFEFKMIIENAMRSSIAGGRLNKIQSILAGLTSFYTSVRAGSLAASHKLYLEKKKYLKIRDVRIQAHGWCTWQTEIHIKNLKGKNMTVTGDEVVYNIASVTKAHNVLFDFNCWLIVFLYLRGAFEYKSLREVLNTQDAILQFKENMKDKPLFIRSSRSGNVLDEDTPATAGSLSDGFGSLVKACGIARAGIHAVRRDTGNAFGRELGVKVAKLLMNHHLSTYDRFYSKGTANIDVTKVRLGEEDTGKKSGTIDHAYNSAAVVAMLGLPETSGDVFRSTDVRIHRGPINPRSKLDALTKEQRQENLNDQVYQTILEQWNEAYSEFIAMFEADSPENAASTYIPKQQNIKKIMESKHLRCTAPASQLKKVVKDLNDLNKKRRRKQKALYKNSRNTNRRAREANGADGKLAGDTLNRRQKAIKGLHKPSALVKPIKNLPELPNVLDMTPAGERIATPEGFEDPGARCARASKQATAPGPLPQLPTPLPCSDITGSESLSSKDVSAPYLSWLDALDTVIPLQEGDTDDEEEENKLHGGFTSFVNLRGRAQSQQRRNAAASTPDPKDASKQVGSSTDTQTSSTSAPITSKFNTMTPQTTTNDCSWTLGDDPDPEQVPCDAIEQDRQEIDVLQISPALLRHDFILHLAAPVLLQREEGWYSKEEDGTWSCRKCKLWAHDEEAQNRRYQLKYSLLRHDFSHQFEWFNLPANMYDARLRKFCCLSSECSFQGDNSESAEAHCLKDCVERKKYQQWKTQYKARNKGRKSHENQVKFRHLRALEGLEQESEDSDGGITTTRRKTARRKTRQSLVQSDEEESYPDDDSCSDSDDNSSSCLDAQPRALVLRPRKTTQQKAQAYIDSHDEEFSSGTDSDFSPDFHLKPSKRPVHRAGNKSEADQIRGLVQLTPQEIIKQMLDHNLAVDNTPQFQKYLADVIYHAEEALEKYGDGVMNNLNA